MKGNKENWCVSEKNKKEIKKKVVSSDLFPDDGVMFTEGVERKEEEVTEGAQRNKWTTAVC